MSAGSIIVIVLVLVVIAVIAALASRALHHQAAWRRRVGPEFGRMSREAGWRRARAEFSERRRRVDRLGLKELSGERRAGYVRQWTAAQERFIDNPAQAASSATALVTAVAAERGYNVSDTDQFLVDLSVDYGRHLDGYRRATRATAHADTAATEDLRQALLGSRALFLDLLGVTRARPSVPVGRPWQQVVPGITRALHREGAGAGAARS